MGTGPGPHHYHQIDAPARRIRVLLEGEVLADSTRALALKEVGRGVHDTVYYFPSEDVDAERLHGSDTRTTCPIKGQASYWSIAHRGEGGTALPDAVWSYENPIEYSKSIEGMLAFDSRRVAIEIGPETVAIDKP
ncbi:MAG: DUF427 domain-containing protein [Gemmatimonadota bacterium]